MPHIRGGLHANTKTIMSFDTTTLCRRMRLGIPCVYCYVERGRASKRCAKTKFEHTPYDGFVLEMEEKVVQSLNRVGGIRMFAYADFFPQHLKDVEQFLRDCYERGLRAKAITKELEFVMRFAEHPAISVVNVSIDSLEGDLGGRSPVSWDLARTLKERYDKVLVRAALLDWGDVQLLGDCEKWVDILTLNHAVWPAREGSRRRTFHLFSKEEKKSLAKEYPARLCGAGPSGKCRDCPIRCGVDCVS